MLLGRRAARPLLPFLFLLFLILPACTTKARPDGASVGAVADRGDLCADLGDHRVCWGCEGGGGPDQVCLVGPARPAPRGTTLRCAGADCRLINSPQFFCTGDECVQRHPRLPDDGEWECIDQDGAVVCRGGESAAGVAAGPGEPGWTCGMRTSGSKEETKPDRICVDLQPDRPHREGPWRCRSDHKLGEKRVCRRAANPKPLLGEACAGGCAPGLVCHEDRCLPARPAPSCWFDTECASQICRQGTCAGEGA